MPQVITIGIGWLRNLYTWRRTRNLIKLHGPTGIPRQDLEARAGVNTNDTPFGIRALQMGIEVEGVWISRSNTPIPGSPVLGPQKSRAPSLAPSLSQSIIGGASINSVTSPSRPTFSHPDEIQIQLDHNRRATHISVTKAHSIHLDSLPSLRLETFDPPFDFSTSEADTSAAVYSSTLDALEGREGAWGKRCKCMHAQIETFTDMSTAPEDGQRSRQKSRSDISVSNYGQSVREGSPSPPALTDGVSRADTPVSEVRSNLTYLSESNHRLSHVAETGQLGHRTRNLKYSETIIPAYGEPNIYRATFNFGPQMLRPSSLKSSSSSPVSPPAMISPSSPSYIWSPTLPKSPLSPLRPTHPNRPKSQSLSDSAIPIVHAPKPVAVRYPDFDVDALSSDPPNLNFDVNPTIPHIRTPSGNFVLATSSLASPNVSDYFQDPPTSLLFPNSRARKSVILTDMTSAVLPPEPAVTSSSASLDYRRVNANFEVKRGTKEIYVPLELPHSSPAPILPLDKKSPKKLTKKRLHSAHRRSKSTPLIQIAAR